MDQADVGRFWGCVQAICTFRYWVLKEVNLSMWRNSHQSYCPKMWSVIFAKEFNSQVHGSLQPRFKSSRWFQVSNLKALELWFLQVLKSHSFRWHRLELNVLLAEPKRSPVGHSGMSPSPVTNDYFWRFFLALGTITFLFTWEWRNSVTTIVLGASIL